jgi:hypothetical protein
MLILLTILVLVAAASAFIYFFNHRNNERQLEANEFDSFPETTPLRPLFEPTEDDIQQAAREAETRAAIDDAQLDEDAARKHATEVRNRLNAWRVAPNRSELGELLRAASFDGELSAQTAEAITDEFLSGKLDGISADDLAELLESHFWLLPAEVRAPAISFRIRETIRELRETEAKASTV